MIYDSYFCKNMKFGACRFETDCKKYLKTEDLLQKCPCCNKFKPTNEQKFVQNVLEKIRKNVIPSEFKYLRRDSITNVYGLSNDYVNTFDSYYVSMINDTLKLIRKGKVAFLFNFNQIKDIMSFHSNITVIVHNDIFCVYLPSKLLKVFKDRIAISDFDGLMRIENFD